jgi:hypothetical protein
LLLSVSGFIWFSFTCFFCIYFTAAAGKSKIKKRRAGVFLHFRHVFAFKLVTEPNCIVCHDGQNICVSLDFRGFPRTLQQLAKPDDVDKLIDEPLNNQVIVPRFCVIEKLHGCRLSDLRL